MLHSPSTVFPNPPHYPSEPCIAHRFSQPPKPSPTARPKEPLYSLAECEDRLGMKPNTLRGKLRGKNSVGLASPAPALRSNSGGCNLYRLSQVRLYLKDKVTQ